eukprot:scaffold497_cov170-Ochromonas_danica.AAC.2
MPHMQHVREVLGFVVDRYFEMDQLEGNIKRFLAMQSMKTPKFDLVVDRLNDWQSQCKGGVSRLVEV